MPGIVENVGELSSNIRETTDKLKFSIPVILQDVEYAASAAKGSIELAGAVVDNLGSGINDTIASFRKDTSEEATGFMAYFPIIKEVLQLILRAFSTSK